jgi:hypothetical protein
VTFFIFFAIYLRYIESHRRILQIRWEVMQIASPPIRIVIDHLPCRMSDMNSARVAECWRKEPRMALVTVLLPGFFTPRIVMQFPEMVVIPLRRTKIAPVGTVTQ